MLFGGCRKSTQTEVPLGLDEKAMRNLARIGHGFLVWERSRRDKWGIWTKRLSGGTEKQLVPEEEGRDHFCPKLSPDGTLLAYMSYARGTHPYLSRKGLTGTLWLMNLSTGRRHVLVDAARSYSEDRAVTWLNKRELAFIDGEGRTMRMNLSKGGNRQVIQEAPELFGYLPSPDLRFATSGTPEFAPLSEDGVLTHQPELGGCQPYFTSDSRWGYWMRGAGGPIMAMRLATRESRPILLKDDPRLNERRNYIYFPMVSPDMRLLAFSASADKHDHFEADYDIYVAALDPRTMDLLGNPVRYTKYSGCDRFPDVFRKEMALGTHFVEGETEIRFRSPEGENRVHWDFGDGKGGDGRVIRHTYSQPGAYWVDATRQAGKKSIRHRGFVFVTPALPPTVKRVLRVDASTVEVLFSEEVDATRAKIRIDQDDATAAVTPTRGDLGLLIKGAKELSADSFVTIEGIRDRAFRPNTMARTVLAVPMNTWPATRDGLAFAWKDALRADRAPSLETARVKHHGLAFPDERGAMKLRGGWFSASEISLRTLGETMKAKGGLTLELVLSPKPFPSKPINGTVLALKGAKGEDLLALRQSGEKLRLTLQTSDGVTHEQAVGDLDSERANHVIITFAGGEIAASTNSGERWTRCKCPGDLPAWQPKELLFGAAADGTDAWRGSMERVAFYNRVLNKSELDQHTATTFAPVLARHPTWRGNLKLRLREASPTPTLAEIQPYREALVRNLYDVVEGGQTLEPRRVVITHWALMDGHAMPAASLKPGDVIEIPVEQVESHPELDSLFVRDTLSVGFEEDHYYDATAWDAPRGEGPPLAN